MAAEDTNRRGQVRGYLIRSSLLPAVALAALAVTQGAAAQLPFDLTREDIAEADTAAMRWTSLSTFVGGAAGRLRYLDEEVSEGECRAVAYLAVLRLRNYYAQRREEPPVALRLGLRCGVPYRGTVEYDGIAVRLELRDHATGRIIYRGSKRGPP